MPLRDDWSSAAEVVRRLDEVFSLNVGSLEILIVDDGSLQKCLRDQFQGPFLVVRAVRILRLRRNVGHQRAIAIGLAHIQMTSSCDAVLVMDSDGEDTPESAVDLLRSFSNSGGDKAIFAERRRRSESFGFRGFYRLYGVLYWCLTGMFMRVGNFSILPAEHLNTLVAMSELWNHYAAAFIRSRLPFTQIPIDRGTRIAGTSKMTFASLVAHGLSAISVVADTVGVRLLIGSSVGFLPVGIGILLVALTWRSNNPTLPAWTMYAMCGLAIVLIQFIAIAAAFTLLVLSGRRSLGFLPFRDCVLFLEEAVDIYTHE